jgi:flagellar hook assembly protein FlgD
MELTRRSCALRSKRLLCSFLILGCCTLAAAGLEAQIVEYIIVDHPSISPNGDGIQDSSAVVIALQEPALRLVVTLEDTVAAAVIDTLLDIANPAAQSYVTVWNGTDSLGAPLPEDGYRLSFYVTDGSTPEEYSRTVIVDTTMPVITLDRIEPGVYTPDIEGTADEVLVYFYLTDFSGPDSVEITLVGPQGLPIDIPHGLLANGLQSVSWAGDETSPDGLYELSLIAHDEAGNGSGDTGYINVDTQGPDLAFVDPIAGPVREVPLTQEGYCWDRNGAEEPFLVWNGSDPFPPHGISWQGDTLFWSFDLRDSVLAGGEYIERICTLQVLCSDVLGHETDENMIFTIDLTPPPPPVLNSPISPVHSPEYNVTGSSPQGDTVIVYRVAGSDTSSWSKPLTLETFGVLVDLSLGDNEIWALAADEAGNRSEPSNRIIVVYDDAAGFYYPEAFRGPDDFEIMTSEEALGVEIRIYTLSGEEVVTLKETGPATRFEIGWSLRNGEGEEVRNGPYLVVITVEYASGKTVDKNFIAVVR